MGASGCGKSTLLSLLGGLDVPTRGEVLLEGQNLYTMTEAQRVSLRRGGIGYIFQGYDLLPALTVLENVEYPLLVSNTDSRKLVYFNKYVLPPIKQRCPTYNILTRH